MSVLRLLAVPSLSLAILVGSLGGDIHNLLHHSHLSLAGSFLKRGQTSRPAPGEGESARGNSAGRSLPVIGSKGPALHSACLYNHNGSQEKAGLVLWSRFSTRFLRMGVARANWKPRLHSPLLTFRSRAPPRV